MILLNLKNKQKRLEVLFEKAKDIKDDELRAHWSRYLCVLTSGLIEVSVSSILSEYTKVKSSHRNVENFVLSRLRQPRNVNMDRILQVTGFFSHSWRSSIESSTTSEMKDAVDSVL